MISPESISRLLETWIHDGRPVPRTASDARAWTKVKGVCRKLKVRLFQFKTPARVSGFRRPADPLHERKAGSPHFLRIFIYRIVLLRTGSFLARKGWWTVEDRKCPDYSWILVVRTQSRVNNLRVSQSQSSPATIEALTVLNVLVCYFQKMSARTAIISIQYFVLAWRYRTSAAWIGGLHSELPAFFRESVLWRFSRVALVAMRFVTTSRQSFPGVKHGYIILGYKIVKT